MSVRGDRLLDERQRVGLQPADARHRLGEREALVEIHAQRQAVADRGPNGGDPRDALVAGAGDLDLGGREPAAQPLGRLARRLLGRDRADPRVQGHLARQGAAEQRVDGHARARAP